MKVMQRRRAAELDLISGNRSNVQYTPAAPGCSHICSLTNVTDVVGFLSFLGIATMLAGILSASRLRRALLEFSGECGDNTVMRGKRGHHPVSLLAITLLLATAAAGAEQRVLPAAVRAAADAISASRLAWDVAYLAGKWCSHREVAHLLLLLLHCGIGLFC